MAEELWNSEIDIIYLDSVDSTNNWVKKNEKSLRNPTFVYCREQSAGRGQRGNTWESEAGKNITASLFFKPDNFPAINQFIISEVIALTIADFLKEAGVRAMVKWPNDIYAGDKKICGILVEHSVTGRNISTSIAGFGLNINQTEFVSDAPNPVSLSMLTLKNYDVRKLAETLARKLEKSLSRIQDSGDIHSEFHKRLWRKDEAFHSFYDRKENRHIQAKIKDVATDGILSIETIDGEIKSYAFKEIEFIL